MARIFICDDEPGLVSLLSDWLKSEGHHVVVNGLTMDMLRCVTEEPDVYDLVILGADKVGIAGTYAWAILRQLSPDTQVVIIHHRPDELSPAAVPPGSAVVIDRETPFVILKQKVGEELEYASSHRGGAPVGSPSYVRPGAATRPALMTRAALSCQRV